MAACSYPRANRLASINNTSGLAKASLNDNGARKFNRKERKGRKIEIDGVPVNLFTVCDKKLR